jgi:hypothetical protein
MTLTKQLKPFQPITSDMPFHLVLQELGYRCVEDVYYIEGFKIFCIGNDVWQVERTDHE